MDFAMSVCLVSTLGYIPFFTLPGKLLENNLLMPESLHESLTIPKTIPEPESMFWHQAMSKSKSLTQFMPESLFLYLALPVFGHA